MSSADNIIYSNTPSLLTLKGSISVYFLDDTVIHGEFATQDAFNIFLYVHDEAMMIPRQQIRFIKGLQKQNIEVDTTQDAFWGDLFTDTPVSVLDTKQDVAEPDDGQTLAIQDEEPFSYESPADENDETLVLFGDDDQFEDDDGTIILGADAADSPLHPIPHSMDDDESTVIFDDDDDFEDDGITDDPTVVLKEPEDSTVSARLTCIDGPHTGEVLELKSGIVTLGRSSDNVFVLSKDNEISRHHAIILQESGKFVIQDQNSLNGTFINEETISSPRYLEHDDLILVGLSLLKYEEL